MSNAPDQCWNSKSSNQNNIKRRDDNTPSWPLTRIHCFCFVLFLSRKCCLVSSNNQAVDSRHWVVDPPRRAIASDRSLSWFFFHIFFRSVMITSLSQAVKHYILTCRQRASIALWSALLHTPFVNVNRSLPTSHRQRRVLASCIIDLRNRQVPSSRTRKALDVFFFFLFTLFLFSIERERKNVFRNVSSGCRYRPIIGL
jgi:hypothetical protein